MIDNFSTQDDFSTHGDLNYLTDQQYNSSTDLKRRCSKYSCCLKGILFTGWTGIFFLFGYYFNDILYHVMLELLLSKVDQLPLRLIFHKK